jgi:three-Cys-motif partner protein
MRKRKSTRQAPDNARQAPLFANLPDIVPPEARIRRPDNPVWTENKARLIARYLYYFVLITKHGTYIDGFAGPQEPEKPQMWAAKLVLESEPKWLRHFHLFDGDRHQAQRLRELKKSMEAKEGEEKREINVYHSDFNNRVRGVLRSDLIGPNEAVFCLLDQRTFECKWSTVRLLAEFKEKPKNKIELFYFLGIGWLKRAISGVRKESLLRDWWGREDWPELRRWSEEKILNELVSRFKAELGYASVKPWPIFDRRRGGGVMYYMIHATDHPEAPALMSRAYARAVRPKESMEQLRLELDSNQSAKKP